MFTSITLERPVTYGFTGSKPRPQVRWWFTEHLVSCSVPVVNLYLANESSRTNKYIIMINTVMNQRRRLTDTISSPATRDPWVPNITENLSSKRKAPVEIRWAKQQTIRPGKPTYMHSFVGAINQYDA